MKTLLIVFCLLLLLGAAVELPAQTFPLGKPIIEVSGVYVCLEKADAVEIVEAAASSAASGRSFRFGGGVIRA